MIYDKWSFLCSDLNANNRPFNFWCAMNEWMTGMEEEMKWGTMVGDQKGHSNQIVRGDFFSYCPTVVMHCNDAMTQSSHLASANTRKSPQKIRVQKPYAFIHMLRIHLRTSNHRYIDWIKCTIYIYTYVALANAQICMLCVWICVILVITALLVIFGRFSFVKKRSEG